MSFALTQTVIDMPGVPAAEKMVLVVLARHANDNGGNVYPSIPLIAAKAGMSDRNARRALRGLEERGLIRALTEKTGGRTPTRYAIVLAGTPRTECPPTPDTMSAPIDEGRTPCPPRPDTLSAEYVSQEETSDAGASEGGAAAPEPPPPTSARGTRWQAGQEVPADWVNWGLDEVRKAGVVGIDVRHEAEQFADYWAGESGAKGLKRDWPATWRVWIRRDIKRAQEGRGNGKQRHHHGQQPDGGLLALAKSKLRQRLEDPDGGPDGWGGVGDDPGSWDMAAASAGF